MNAVGSKWVFKPKFHPDIALEWLKARLVVKDFHQESGVDFLETYSPVIRPTTIRVVLSLACSQGWELCQCDIDNIFLHGNLTELVFMAQPPGFRDPVHPNHVCQLARPIYGLEQSSGVWYDQISEVLLSFGFYCSPYDPSLYISQNNGIHV